MSDGERDETRRGGGGVGYHTLPAFLAQTLTLEGGWLGYIHTYILYMTGAGEWIWEVGRGVGDLREAWEGTCTVESSGTIEFELNRIGMWLWVWTGMTCMNVEHGLCMCVCR